MKKGVAIGGLILVTVIWGGGFVASDMALESMKPFQIMMVRFLLASVLMGLVSMGQRKKEAKIENRAGAIKAGMLMGLTLFAGFALQIVGLQYTTPSKNAHVCIRRDRLSGYDQGMAQRLISRCDQHDHLLSAPDRLSEVRGRNKGSHHTLYGVRIWNGVFHYHSA